MEKTSDLKKEEDIFVANASSYKNSYITSLVSINTDPIKIDDTFYKKNDNFYAVLESTDCLEKLRPASNNNQLIIPCTGIINKISLLDFPHGQYILSLNNRNCCTAKYNNKNKLYEFDFSIDQTEMLQIITNVTQSDREPYIVNRDNYVNFYRLDNIIITFPKNHKLSTKHTIRLHGYFYTDNGYLNEDRYFYIYPCNTYRLNINFPTESVDLLTDNAKGKVILRLDDTDIDIKQTENGLTKIRFNDYLQKFNYSSSNSYLSSEINKQTINMSNIKCYLITLECKILQLQHNHYKIYRYPERTQYFMN